MTPFPWNEWATVSTYRIRIAPAAVEKLESLPPDTQDRLRRMLQDIAELADLMPPSGSTGWAASTPPLLHLQMGRVSVRYALNEKDRVLSVEHVIVPGDELSDVG